MAVKAQKTGLWFQNATTGVIIKLQCAKSISGLSASRDQVETTCLDEDVRTYEAGLPTPGTASVAIDPDPKYTGHKELQALHVTGEKVNFINGWSDGTSSPTAALGVTGGTISNGGSGYTGTVAVAATGGTGSGFAGVAVLTGGVVTGITVTTPGNYTVPPTALTFTGGVGTGAVGVPVTAWSIVPGAARTWQAFNAYVADYPFEFQPGQMVSSTVALQLSGFVAMTWKV